MIIGVLEDAGGHPVCENKGPAASDTTVGLR